MANFSAVQLQAMAQSLHDVGVEIGQVRLDAIGRGRPLNDPEIVQMLGQNLSLLNLSSAFAGQAAQVSLNDVASAVNEVQSATGEAKEALAGLQRLDKAIRVGASVIVLGSSVFTGDVQQIGHAAQGVYAAAES